MTVDRAAGVVTFDCASAEKAEAVLSKLIADFTWDSLLGVKPVAVKVGKVEASGWALPEVGVVLVAQRGSAVLVIGGKDAGTVGARATGLHLDAAGVKRIPWD